MRGRSLRFAVLQAMGLARGKIVGTILAEYLGVLVYSIVAGIALHSAVMALAATERRMAIMIRLSMTLMILGWATLMTSQLANVKFFKDATVALEPSSLLPSWFPSEFSLLTASQIGIVLFALFLALISLPHVNFMGTSFWTRLGTRITPIVFAGYAVAVIAILVT